MGKRERKISRFIGRWITEQGAGTVEYVIVIFVAVVIGSGLLAFGNQVSGQVTKTGNNISSWFSKANGTGGTGGGNAGGGNSGTDSRIDELKEKDPADWTLDDQKAVAEDIGKKGNSSELYAKAKDAMDAGTTWSITLTDGQTLTYRIIGINHDDLADGSGKAGLTFLTTSFGIRSRMNATETNVGGWERSELRAKMNSGEIWNLMPSDFQSKVKSVRKLTNNVGNSDENAAVTATTDKLFLLSYSEIVPISYWVDEFPWTSSEGTQYEAFKGKVTENFSIMLVCRLAMVGGSVRCIWISLRTSSLSAATAIRQPAATRWTRLASPRLLLLIIPVSFQPRLKSGAFSHQSAWYCGIILLHQKDRRTKGESDIDVRVRAGDLR